jgi:hypothetical protein
MSLQLIHFELVDKTFPLYYDFGNHLYDSLVTVTTGGGWISVDTFPQSQITVCDKFRSICQIRDGKGCSNWIIHRRSDQKWDVIWPYLKYI